MNVIGALEAGFTVQQILNYLSQAFPELGSRMQEALGAGKSAEQILKYLSRVDAKHLSKLRNGSPRKIYPDVPNRNPYIAATEAQKERNPVPQTLQSLAKAGLYGGALAGGGLLAGRALQNVAQLQPFKNLVSGRGLPKAPGRKAASLAPEAMGQAQETISQPTPDESGVASQRRAAADIVKDMGLEQRIRNLQGNNPPEVIGPAIKSMLTPGQKTWLKSQTDQPIEEIVNEYMQQTPEEIQEKLVITPEGEVGSLVEERQGIGAVRLPSGEMRRRKVADLDEESPELAKQINDVISSLPEEEKSRVLAFASYNPGHTFSFEGKEMNIPMMGVQFHNGDFYMYPGVSKDQFDKVVQKATKAKTSGENEWGVWTQGDPSRGAGMHELIKELEKDFGKNFIKFKASEGYDFWKRFRKELKEYFLKRKRNQL